MKRNNEKKIVMETVLNDPRYRGYHVVVVDGKVFKAKTGKTASRILEKVRQQYPRKTPAVTYIPNADTLIL